LDYFFQGNFRINTGRAVGGRIRFIGGTLRRPFGKEGRFSPGRIEVGVTTFRYFGKPRITTRG